MQNERSKKIKKIVITGGPCGGKTTAMNWVQNAFTDRGYYVLFIPETATELINGGLSAKTCVSQFEFQKSLLELQMLKERIYEEQARLMPVDKVLIVCDRGALDGMAFAGHDEFCRMASMFGKNEMELRENYDAVFHLVTAAKGAEEFYTTANNTARTETPEEAAAVDDRLINAWTGHPRFRIISNADDFDTKMHRLIEEISRVLDEPMPYVAERKFLIRYPDVAAMESDPDCKRVNIVQTYLSSAPGEELRLRERESQGMCIYYLTRKYPSAGGHTVQTERRLTREEYELLLEQADPKRRQIRKARYYAFRDGSYYKIDVYPEWTDQAIAEVELQDGETDFTPPEWLQVIREVTGDERFRNSTLAMR